MTKSEIFRSAHKQAKETRLLYSSYAEAMAEILQAIYRDLRNPPAPVGGFQIVEPWYKRRMWSQATGQWVTL